MSTSIRRVPPREAARLVAEEGYVLVDVRTEAEFVAAHPRGAVHLASMVPAAGGLAPNPGFAEALAGAFGKDAKLILTCRSGQRSLRAAELLGREGFTAVVDQLAGMEGARDPFGQILEKGWRDAGLPVDAGPGATLPGR